MRPATARDAERLAALTTQLGYPSSSMQLAARLRVIETNPEHFVAVAEVDGEVVGWVHVYVKYSLDFEPRGELGGIVVDETHRGLGIGELLMNEAERWSKAKGLAAIYLRSNVKRQTAHGFYEKLGYKLIKTQHAFLKALK